MAETPATQTETGGLKIIGAGFGRTGTLSLKAALEELGFGPCYHMLEVFHHPEHVALWEAASKGQPVNWHQVFEEYQATVDWPGCTFYEQFMEAYPDAKVLLTVRDPDKWYESVQSTIYRMRDQGKGLKAMLTTTIFFVMRLFNPQMRRSRQLINDLIWKGTFENNFPIREHALAVFCQHIEQVKQRVPAERLLVYDIKEGWEPLCAFLGVEVPKDTPFPHLNDRANFVGMRALRLFRRGLVSVLVAVGVLAAFFILRRWHG